jgi:hypothetical protein
MGKKNFEKFSEKKLEQHKNSIYRYITF